MRARRGPNEPLREAAHAPETTMPACAGIEILAERGSALSVFPHRNAWDILNPPRAYFQRDFLAQTVGCRACRQSPMFPQIPV